MINEADEIFLGREQQLSDFLSIPKEVFRWKFSRGQTSSHAYSWSGWHR